MRAIVITDLDGTLLNHRTYDAGEAAAAVRSLQDRGIPVCICSSKTRGEIMHYRRALDIGDPFISENGGAIFIPKGYFGAGCHAERFRPEELFEIVELGTPYPMLTRALREVREETEIRIRGFHELTAEGLAVQSGLNRHMAALALQREYDEPFSIEGDPEDIEFAKRAFLKRSLSMTRGGRYFHVTGGNDKGRAVDVLKARFMEVFPDAIFAGLGDSPNDIPMLKRVDVPVLVKGPSGEYDEETMISVPHVRLADGIGPQGWNAAVDSLFLEWR